MGKEFSKHRYDHSISKCNIKFFHLRNEMVFDTIRHFPTSIIPYISLKTKSSHIVGMASVN